MRTPYVVSYSTWDGYTTEGLHTWPEVMELLHNLDHGTQYAVYSGDCNLVSRGTVFHVG